MLENQYPQYGVAGALVSNPVNFLDALKIRKQSLEVSLEQVNRGIALLEKNPDIAEILDVLKKTLHC